MADMDIQSYLTNKLKTTGADSVSKGGVTVSKPGTPIDVRGHPPGPVPTATDHRWDRE